MYRLLKGGPVRDALESEIEERVHALSRSGKVPCIATFRIGDDDGEIYYEKSIHSRAKKYGIDSRAVVLGEDAPQEEAERELKALNDDRSVNGIIMLMPFPKSTDGERLRALLDPSKDIDAITDASYASLFANRGDSFFACTAEACMEILKYYDVPLRGSRMTIVGRSLRVGKPFMLMAMNANATVTVCHTKTRDKDLRDACRNADILVIATGQTEGFSADMLGEGQVLIDVGTGTGRDGKMAGDFDAATLDDAGAPEELWYTPVPGGVGTVTTTLLMRNVVTAAERQAR
jgi:methylenetetrahydrofolate dehydrogenase (NADP+)/methenyltetrahydrofolate cyclohydrolase